MTAQNIAIRLNFNGRRYTHTEIEREHSQSTENDSTMIFEVLHERRLKLTVYVYSSNETMYTQITANDFAQTVVILSKLTSI